MAEKSGRSVSELKDMMSQGKISAQDVTKAFQIATSEGGLFFGNLEAQSKTLAGKLSTLKDNVVTGLQNMAEAFLPLLKKMADAVIAIDWGRGQLSHLSRLLLKRYKRLTGILIYNHYQRLAHYSALLAAFWVH